MVGGNSNGHGPGGFIAGGGMGPLTPSFGLALDNVLEIKVLIRNKLVSLEVENDAVVL